MSNPIAKGLYASNLISSIWQHSARAVSKVLHKRLHPPQKSEGQDRGGINVMARVTVINAFEDGSGTPQVISQES